MSSKRPRSSSRKNMLSCSSQCRNLKTTTSCFSRSFLAHRASSERRGQSQAGAPLQRSRDLCGRARNAYNNPWFLDSDSEKITWAAPSCRIGTRRRRVGYEKAVRQSIQGQSSPGSPEGREDLTGTGNHLRGPSEHDCALEKAGSGTCVDGL